MAELARMGSADLSDDYGVFQIEMYALVSQLRRAAVSVPANIAEGFKRRGKADKIRLFNIAQGSLEESRYYLILAQDLGYAETTAQLIATDEISRMLDGYVRAISDDS